ncbi:HAD-like domain-containing protein [Tribonema minus]|uniref:Mitochondrial import inner membrane translocase subunit TIM50 n=1 Tax=Tribonema minus TaxID=303371 RepID=A0A836C8A4_9STRA|nr:HAD-like domain-containing protein [Tribonema minus]
MSPVVDHYFDIIYGPNPASDYQFDVIVDSCVAKVFAIKRPGVDEFLEQVSKHYEVIVFTASLPEYANPLLDLLDPKGYITGRLFREHCTRVGGFSGDFYLKNLTLLRDDMDLSNIIIVENNRDAYMLQPTNGNECTTWRGDPWDHELFIIADFLEKIKDVTNVRD